MKKIVISGCMLAIHLFAHNSLAFSLWKTCISFDTSKEKIVLSDELKHQIVNADVLRVWNETQEAYAQVNCLQGPSRHPFSNYDDGEPIFPDSSVHFPYDKDKICEGDVIYVYGRECHIISMTLKKKENKGTNLFFWPKK